MKKLIDKRRQKRIKKHTVLTSYDTIMVDWCQIVSKKQDEKCLSKRKKKDTMEKIFGKGENK